jgi:hypothetical protein
VIALADCCSVIAPGKDGGGACRPEQACECRGALRKLCRAANVRVLVYEARCVVDFVMDYNVQVLLGVVLRDVGVGEFLVGHCGRV